MKRYHFLINDIPEHKDKVKAILLQSRQRLYWMKNGKTYHWHCSHCGASEDVDYKRMQQIKNAELCPHCFNSLRPTHSRKANINAYIIDGCDGYDVSGHWDMFDGWQDVEYYHCLHIEDDKEYIRGIARSMGGGLCAYMRYKDTDPFRIAHTSYWQMKHSVYFYEYDDCKRTYREYLLKSEITRGMLKSNQYTLVRNGLYNDEQIKGIIKYDLKTDEQVQKHSKYFKCNENMRIENKHNIFTLEYLDKNNINANDYDDYCYQCDVLGVKRDKPKDFKIAHDNYSREIEQRNNAKNDELIRERLRNVSMFEYNHKNMSVKAFTGYENLLEVANTLHNCMASNFCKPYANGITDIFYGTINDEIAFGIEVKDKKLMQLRGARNENVSPAIKRFVKKWCKQYEISCVF